MEVSPKSNVFCLQVTQNSINRFICLFIHSSLFLCTCWQLYLVAWLTTFPGAELFEHVHYYVAQLDGIYCPRLAHHVGSHLKETDSLLHRMCSKPLNLHWQHCLYNSEKILQLKMVWRSGCSPASVYWLLTTRIVKKCFRFIFCYCIGLNKMLGFWQ